MNADEQAIRQMERQTERDAVIYAIYGSFEEAEPDISTERLLQQTADAAHCDVARVISALRRLP